MKANFYKRAITGAAIVTVIVCSLYLGVYAFFLFSVLIALLGLHEFYRLFGVTTSPLRIAGGFTLAVTLFVAVFAMAVWRVDEAVWLINLPIISFLFLTVLFRKGENTFLSLALTFLGIIYVVLPFLLLFVASVSFPDRAFSPLVILGYFILLWANDTGAYVAGTLWGHRKLAPLISPNKTWEGSAGGAGSVAVCAFVISRLIPELSVFHWLMVGLIVIVMGTLGDLVKSVMKRSLRVKDSGTILPGHGGILDRFDSLIGSIPFVYMLLSILNR